MPNFSGLDWGIGDEEYKGWVYRVEGRIAKIIKDYNTTAHGERKAQQINE